MEELPLRTRWVDYKEAEYDASHIEPGCTRPKIAAWTPTAAPR
ncbi:unnamed protein product [Penicillium nalgiovense]|nr:unnamed protein product [Penicillium nalgiovense]CAG7941739.1 unnamed protein product [Penicillium nalgiovense]CAG7945270.1 unnamed protein product [Penicillium nalgiovense]CAG7951958.1 unnamed protein product [Penicillium nalgiovense]CAG7959843.1 unnamed protein product [Penicillium nalgiovense]